MAELSYATKSISDISKDNIVNQIGTVLKNSDGSITLQDNSQCTFAYNYNTTNNKMECESLKVEYSVETSNTTRTTRYNAAVTIDVTVHYYKESFNENGVSQGYVDGSYQFTRIMPPFRREINGYVDSIEIGNESGMYIKQIGITLGFYSGEEVSSSDNVTFGYVRVYNSRTTQQVVTDTYGWSAVISSVTVKPNGYALKYDGVAEQTTLLIDIEDIEGTPTLVQIIVNSTKDSEKVIKVDADDIPIPRD